MRVGVQNGISTEPNMVPMIDVLLVLIIIFMLLLGRHVIRVQLPVANGTAASDEETLVLEVLDSEGYRINGTVVPAASLVDSLAAIFRERPNKLLFVRGDRGQSYLSIITAMDAAKEAGVEVLGWMPNPHP